MPHIPGVYKKGNHWHAYGNYKGKRYYVPGGYETAEQARDAGKKYREELQAGVTDKRNLTAKEFIELFFKDYACTWEKQSKNNTWIKIKKHIYPHIKSKKLRDIDEIDIQRIFNSVEIKNLADSTKYELKKLTRQ
jgi:hypothetical protein